MFPGDSGYGKYKVGKFSTARCYTCVDLALIFHYYPFYFAGKKKAFKFTFLLRKYVIVGVFFPEKKIIYGSQSLK